jgi:hypothetical protein
VVGAQDVDRSFADDHTWSLGVSGGHPGHDGSIGDPEPVDSVHLQAPVNDGKGIGAHLHVANPSEGCSTAALSVDVGRAGASTRATYERKLAAWAARIAKSLDGPRQDSERRAWSILSLMVGAISIARAMSNAPAQKAVVNSARRTADRLMSSAE